MKVIIAEINKMNSYEDFYSKTRKYKDDSCNDTIGVLKDSFASIQNSIDFYCVYDFEEMKSLVDSFSEENKILVFSNFPPNNTYKRYKIINDSRHDRTYINADGYDITKNNYKKLLRNNINIELYVITGAPESLLSRIDVVTLIGGRKTSYANKADWPRFSTDDYTKYIIRKIRDRLPSKDSI